MRAELFFDSFFFFFFFFSPFELFTQKRYVVGHQDML